MLLNKFWRTIVLLVLIAVPGGLTLGFQPRGAAESDQPVSQRTGKFTLMALGDNQIGDLRIISHRYDLLIASHSVKRDLIDEFRKNNRGARVFCYFNTSDVNLDWIKDPFYDRLWNDTNPKESWFHHDSTGQRVRIYFPKYKNRMAFDTGHPELQRYLARRVVELLQTGLYDGIQLDNVSTEFPFKEDLIGKWISSTPVDLTPQEWTSDEISLLQTIGSSVTHSGIQEATIIFNHMRSGEPQESRAYVDVSDGANCEFWMTQRTDLAGRWGWKAKVEQVQEINRTGKLTNLLCVPSRQSEDEALFCFASYLMALDGENSYFFYGTNYQIAGQQNAWYDFYDINLGVPVDNYQLVNHAIWRPFSRGAVAVNPTGHSVTMTLPRPYLTREGQQVDQISLEPKRAALLLAPAVK